MIAPTFEKAKIEHKQAIFSWLKEPHVQEFWDNTQAHKDDILNFINGRKEDSSYMNGQYAYWIASTDDHPFALIMTIQESKEEDIGEAKLQHLSQHGTTYGLEYMIGDPNYIGKGYGACVIAHFVDFFRLNVDLNSDTFFIDPAADNPRAKHVYENAEFKHVADFIMTGDVSGVGKPHHLLVKRFESKSAHEKDNI